MKRQDVGPRSEGRGQSAKPGQVPGCQPCISVAIRGAMAGRIVDHKLSIVIPRDLRPILTHQKVKRLGRPERP